MMNAIVVYNSILENFMNINRNYISQTVGSSMVDSADNFHAFCDVYNQQYYGRDGSERFNTEAECINFIGPYHIDEVLRQMRDFVNEDSYSDVVEIVDTVNAWRYEQIEKLSYSRFYYDIVLMREVA